MKIPAVAMAAAFAGGIALGRSALVAAHATQRWFLLAVVADLEALRLLAFLFAWRDFFRLVCFHQQLVYKHSGASSQTPSVRAQPPDHAENNHKQ